MNALTNHPVFNRLMDHEADAHQIHLDDRALEKLMSQEDNQFTGTVSTVRIVEVNDVGISQYKPAEGNLTSRIFSLVEATHWCELQADFQESVLTHPAFALIRDELRAAHLDGTLDQKFDTIEATGATVTFDKFRGLATIGLNEPQMRKGIRELTKLVDIRNRRLINHINGVTALDIFKEPGDTPVDKVEMSTTYFVSFAV